MGIQRIRLNRLHGEVRTLHHHLAEARRRVERGVDDEAHDALQTAQAFLSDAEDAAAAGELQRGWKRLHRAQEALVGTHDDAHLRVVARDLLRRARSLDAGSRETLHEWLREGVPGDSLLERRRNVQLAMRTCNECWDRFYHGALLAQQRLNYLAFVLAMVLSVLMAAATAGSFGALEGVERPGSFVAGVVALGMAGGTASAMLGIVTGSTERILAEQVRDGPWYLLRPLFGAGSALVIVLALAAGLLGLQPERVEGYYAVAAFAGFSEGLITRVAGGFAANVRVPSLAEDADTGSQWS